MWTFGGDVYHQLGRTPRPGGGAATSTRVPELVTQFRLPPPDLGGRAQGWGWGGGRGWERGGRGRGGGAPWEDELVTSPSLVAISAGDWHSAAVDAQGRLYCWGANSGGQCGDGPDRVEQPRAMGGELRDQFFVDVACGGSYTIGLTRSGEVFLWGKVINHWSQTAVHAPTQLHCGQSSIVKIAGGWAHAACIDTEGRLYLFGAGAFGRMGLGHNEDIPPTSPMLYPASSKTKVAQVALGLSFSLVLTQDGKIYASGDNSRGQLGNNMKSDRNKLSMHPVLVEGISEQGRIVHIAAGSDHAAAVLADGRVYVWGDNKHGMLGLGDREIRSVPTQVTALSSVKVVRVGCGSSHTIFITDLGKAYICGGGKAVASTQRDTVCLETPQELEGVQLVTHAACGEEHTILMSLPLTTTNSSLKAALSHVFNRRECFADVQFKIDGQLAFYAHKCIISCSPALNHYLQKQLEHLGARQTESAQMLDIDLPKGICKGALEMVLRALYGGQPPTPLALLKDELTILRKMFGVETRPYKSDCDSASSSTSSSPSLMTKLVGRLVRPKTNHQQHPSDPILSHKPEDEQHDNIMTWVRECLLPMSQSQPPSKENEGSESADPLEGHMRWLVNNPLYSDVNILIEDRTIHAHKAILAARCPYFATMFSTGMRESNEGAINMTGSDLSYSGLRKLLVYLYTNTLDIQEEDPDIDAEADDVKPGKEERERAAEEEEGEESSHWLEECLQLINIAESYQLPHLKHLAEQKAITGINYSTVAQLLESATVLRASALREACVAFLTRNWHTIKHQHEEVIAHIDPITKNNIVDYLRRNFRL